MRRKAARQRDKSDQLRSFPPSPFSLITTHLSIPTNRPLIHRIRPDLEPQIRMPQFVVGVVFESHCRAGGPFGVFESAALWRGERAEEGEGRRAEGGEEERKGKREGGDEDGVE